MGRGCHRSLAGGQRLQRGHHRSARLDGSGRIQRAGSAEALHGHHRGEHGLDGEPLHGVPPHSIHGCLLPGGEKGQRPDRATIPYVSRARQALPGVPIVVGGVEASLRRLVHYDFWQDKIRGSILLDAKADLLVYGMGELAVVEIARRLADGHSIKDCRDIPGTAYALGAKDPVPEGEDVITLPSLAECKRDRRA